MYRCPKLPLISGLVWGIGAGQGAGQQRELGGIPIIIKIRLLAIKTWFQ
jgi:hypothetical protein